MADADQEFLSLDERHFAYCIEASRGSLKTPRCSLSESLTARSPAVFTITGTQKQRKPGVQRIGLKQQAAPRHPPRRTIVQLAATDARRGQLADLGLERRPHFEGVKMSPKRSPEFGTWGHALDALSAAVKGTYESALGTLSAAVKSVPDSSTKPRAIGPYSSHSAYGNAWDRVMKRQSDTSVARSTSMTSPSVEDLNAIEQIIEKLSMQLPERDAKKLTGATPRRSQAAMAGHRSGSAPSHRWTILDASIPTDQQGIAPSGEDRAAHAAMCSESKVSCRPPTQHA